MIHKNVAAPSGVRFKKKIKKTVFTKIVMSTNKYAQTGSVLMNLLNALKAYGLVYRSKDRKERREMFYVVCNNFYVLSDTLSN